MKRHEFEHAIRAAGAVLGVSELVVIGSQALHGSLESGLDVHDLWIVKAIAGRPKDVEFCRALVARRLVNATTLAERLDAVGSLDARVRSNVEARIRAMRE